MATIGELSVNVVARTGGLTRGMNQARKEMGVFSSGILGVRRNLLLLGAAFTTFQGVKQIAALTAQAESAKKSFGVLAGSVERGTKLYQELRDLAKATPLQMDPLARQARTLMLFGIEADKVTDTLKRMGDVTGGNAQAMDFMARAWGQIHSLGRLQAQDLLQLVNAGWTPFEEIVKKTGKSVEELRNDMKDGKLGFDQVQGALEAATNEGGRFHGMMDEMSETLQGRWNKLIGQIQELAISMGEKLMPMFERAIHLASVFVDWISQINFWWVKVAAVVAGFIGWLWTIVKVYRVVVMVTQAWAAAQSAVAVAKAAIAAMSQNWAAVAAGITAATALAGALGVAYIALDQSMRNQQAKQRETNKLLRVQNAELGEAARLTGGMGGTKRGGIGWGVETSEQQQQRWNNDRIKRARLPVHVNNKDVVDAVNKVTKAVGGTTKAVKENKVGMAGGL